MEPGGQDLKKSPSELTAKHKKQQTTGGWENVLKGLAELRKPKCAAATGANVVICSGKRKVHLHQSLVRKFTRISDWLPNLSECTRYDCQFYAGRAKKPIFSFRKSPISVPICTPQLGESLKRIYFSKINKKLTFAMI